MMSLRSPFAVLGTALLLAACASTPPAKQPPAPAPAPQPPATPATPPAPAPSANDAAHTPAFSSHIWRSPPVAFPPGTPLASRIVQIAQRELDAWHQPFIDAGGRLLSRRTAEAENARLKDGSRAWERVAAYWRDSGTLARISDSRSAALQCLQPPSDSYARNECRSFVIDVPWSAAFISYVMVQAGAPEFRTSPSHIDYIRAAWREQGPYRLHDPNQTPVALGDMLCYIRNNSQIVSYGGLVGFLSASNGGLQSHCDIAVNLLPGEVWLVGGNVANMVTLRKLRLDAQGRAQLPRPVSTDWVGTDEEGQSPACSPSNEAACSMNRQNWAALLKLQPQ